MNEIQKAAEHAREINEAAQHARELAAKYGIDSPEATAARKKWALRAGLGWIGA